MRSLPFLLFGSVLLAPLAAQQRVSYGRDIRPLLADHCFQCHGPDAAAREAELRLDLRADAIAERDGYHVIAPGDAGASELLRRIQDDEDPMPPAEHARLGRREVELLRRWIVEGAAYDVHWAYVAPRRVTPPPMAARDWVRNEVDHFVLGRLDAAARQPAPEADPRTLVRRLSFDLLGLPPTWEQVSAFAARRTTASPWTAEGAVQSRAQVLATRQIMGLQARRGAAVVRPAAELEVRHAIGLAQQHRRVEHLVDRVATDDLPGHEALAVRAGQHDVL